MTAIISVEQLCKWANEAAARIARLEAVADAARAWEADLSSDCDTDDRTMLRKALAELDAK